MKAAIKTMIKDGKVDHYARRMKNMPFMTPQGLIQTFRRYNQIIAEVVDETGAILIDGESLIPGDTEHFNDSVHFKDTGSRIMAGRVRGALLKSTNFQSLVEQKKIAGQQLPLK